MKRFRRQPPAPHISGEALYIIEGGRSASIDAYTAAQLCGHPSVYRPPSERSSETSPALKLIVATNLREVAR